MYQIAAKQITRWKEIFVSNQEKAGAHTSLFPTVRRKQANLLITDFFLFSVCLGLFSGLKMEFNFHRKSVYYLIQIYIPSGMIVVLSWVSNQPALYIGFSLRSVDTLKKYWDIDTFRYCS